MTDYDRPYRGSAPRRRSMSSGKKETKGSVIVTQMIVCGVGLLLVMGVKWLAPAEFQTLKTVYVEIMEDNRTYEMAQETFHNLLKQPMGENSLAQETAGLFETSPFEGETQGQTTQAITPSVSQENALPIALPLQSSLLPVSLTVTPNAEQAAPETASYTPFVLNQKMIIPLQGRITSPYGYRIDPFTGEMRFHHGVDIGGDGGEEVLAAFAGRVLESGYDAALGNYVKLQHDATLVTVYGHCEKLLVQAGEDVAAGQKIATVGSTGRSTGPHLHFEIRINGIRYDPSYVL